MNSRRAIFFLAGIVILVFLMAWNNTSGELNPEDKKNAPMALEESAINQTGGNNIIENQTEDFATRWYNTNTPEKTKGVALVIHGLNLRPDKMESVISKLRASGIDVLNLSLRGHGENYDHHLDMDDDSARMEAFSAVSYPLWMNEAYLAYLQVKKRGERQKVPLFLIAYSFGGLVGLDLFASNHDVHFDRMVLFAPAIKLHAIYYVERALSPFPRLVIPSLLAPKSYLSNIKGTPIAAYNALFEGLALFEKHANQKINIPTLVFIDEQDEFIPKWALKKLVEEKKMDKWHISIVQKGKEAYGNYHHHMIDEFSAGKAVWKEMMETTITYLLANQPN